MTVKKKKKNHIRKKVFKSVRCGKKYPYHCIVVSNFVFVSLWVILVSTRKVCPLQLFLRCPTFADPCRWTRQRFRQHRLRTDSLRRNPEMESLSTDVCFQCGYGQVLEGFHVVFLGNLCCCLYFVDICVNIVHWSEIALRCFDSRLLLPKYGKS